MSNITFLLNLFKFTTTRCCLCSFEDSPHRTKYSPSRTGCPKNQGEQWHQCLWTSRTLVQCHPTFRVSHCTVALRNHWNVLMCFFHPFWWLNWLWWSLGYAVRSLKCACYEVLRLAAEGVLTYNYCLGWMRNWPARIVNKMVWGITCVYFDILKV